MSSHTTPRMEKLLRLLKSRTDRHGEPLSGYAQNVAQIKAEIALLTESQEITEDGR